MKKIVLIIGGIFGIGASAFSQDLHFSQYTENPSLVNPALTGSQYVMRASVIYKDQWRSVTVPPVVKPAPGTGAAFVESLIQTVG